MKKADKSSFAGTKVDSEQVFKTRRSAKPITKPAVSRRAFVLTRKVAKKECPWLERVFKKGEVVYEYTGYTYGCISWNGKAFTEKENETPFFELPNDAVSQHGG